MSDASGGRSYVWRYSVCGLLLLATMLNYMDRMTLSQLATTIRYEYDLSHAHYGGLEEGFGYAFAAGALVSLLDRDETTHPQFRLKLEAVGFGVFIPIFFTSTQSWSSVSDP